MDAQNNKDEGKGQNNAYGHEEGDDTRRSHDNGTREDGPEPPLRWKPDSPHLTETNKPTVNKNDADTRVGMIGSARIELSGADIAAFESARRLITVSQITALISFLIGGVLLSGFALACAVIAYRRLNGIAVGEHSSPEMKAALRRVGIMAIGLAAIAFTINVVALAMFYPTVIEAMQSGNVDSLIGSPGSTGTSTGNQTWG